VRSSPPARRRACEGRRGNRRIEPPAADRLSRLRRCFCSESTASSTGGELAIAARCDRAAPPEYAATELMFPASAGNLQAASSFPLRSRSSYHPSLYAYSVIIKRRHAAPRFLVQSLAFGSVGARFGSGICGQASYAIMPVSRVGPQALLRWPARSHERGCGSRFGSSEEGDGSA
jgi:hypothetical protein